MTQQTELEKCQLCKTMKRNCVVVRGDWWCKDCYFWADSYYMLEREYRDERQAEVAQK